jgi:hypothetical protein
MATEIGPGTRPGRRLARIAALAITALWLAACTAALPTPSPSSGQSPEASGAEPTIDATATLDLTTDPAPASPSVSPESTDSPAPTPESSTTPGPTPTPRLPTGPLPSLGPVPSGPWTGIDWVELPAGHYPQLPAHPKDWADTWGDLSGMAVVAGWSEGYVEFMWNPIKHTVTPWGSSDGLTWHSGPGLDIGAWATTLKANASIPEIADYCRLVVTQFEEGPSTLLMTAAIDCPPGCGGPTTSDLGAWTSPDGVNWTPLDLPKTFAGAPASQFSGSATGFVSLGYSNGDASALWLSSDGRSWHQGTLPANFTNTLSHPNAPASFAGGYVLPAVIRETPGDDPITFGCAGSRTPPRFHGVIWWTPDGTNWTRETLPGVFSADDVEMWVWRIDDHTLLAIESTYEKSAAWLSTDGRTWVRTSSEIRDWTIVTGRDRGLVCDSTSYGGAKRSLYLINDALQLGALKQTGDLPWWAPVQLTMGATGIVATADGTRFWIGIPTTD